MHGIDEEFLRGLNEPGVMDRMARMHGWALRGVLAMVDDDAPALAQVIADIKAFDAEADQLPGGVNRWMFVGMRVSDLGKELQRMAQDSGVYVPLESAVPGTVAILERLAPPDRREAAVELVLHQERIAAQGGRTAELVLFQMALTAWLARIPGLAPVLEVLRLELRSRIADVEGEAAGIPRAERITRISDADAFDFLEWLFDGPGIADVMSRDPADWSAAEHQVISIVKQHLLETPVPESTTPEQKKAMLARLIQIFQAAVGTPVATASPVDTRTTGRPRPSARNTKRRPGDKKRKRR
ncbi:hypothetical protein ABH935_006984 [Catenulispora sp. GAS73]|uniref:hypothetical protein n=1 Tax=Catenulispora sp. GAS73 TaxID=3156269 RepID=UPI003514896E